MMMDDDDVMGGSSRRPFSARSFRTDAPFSRTSIQLPELVHGAEYSGNSAYRYSGRESLPRTSFLPYRRSTQSSVYQTEVLINEEDVSLMVMTWNCGGKDPYDALPVMKKVLQKYLVADTSIVVFGLQEVCELNFNSFIRTSARKQMYKNWEKFLTDAVTHFGDYCLVSRDTELMGLQMVVFATPSLVPSLSFCAASYVMCGGGGFVGNKGGVGWRMNVNQTSIAFCCVHLSAGHGSKAAEMRVLDAQNVENMEFEYRMRRWSLGDHDVVIFLGDTNSRLMVEQDDAKDIMDDMNDSLYRRQADQIAKKYLHNDELLQLQTNGDILAQFCEAPIHFPPTYKHVVGVDNFDAAGMTASGKIRVPGWTDRVFYKCSSNRQRETNFMVESYSWEPQLQLSDHRPVVLTARFSTLRIARPMIMRETLVPLLTKSPTRTYLYPFRAVSVMLRWRLSTNVLLGYAFMSCWLLSMIMVAFLSCSSEDIDQCGFTVIYDYFCSGVFTLLKGSKDPACLRQILFCPETMLFESILVYGFISQIFLAVVKESLFNRTIHALGSEVIATHVDSVLKGIQASSYSASIALFFKRAFVEFIFGSLHLLWSNAWFFIFASLFFQITVAIGGPPHCEADLRGYKTRGFYEPSRCSINHWSAVPETVRDDWAWRRWFILMSYIPWLVMQGVSSGLLPIITLSSFFQETLTLRDILATFWRVKWGFFPFGVAAALISTIPVVNLLAPMSNAVAVALWVIDVERMLQVPRTLTGK